MGEPGDTAEHGVPAEPTSSGILGLRFQWGGTALFALVIGETRSLTLPATVLVAAAGLAIMVAGQAAVPDPQPHVDQSISNGLVIWGALFVALCLWELAAFLLGNNNTHPTASILSDPIMSWYPTRVLAGYIWLTGGRRFLRS
jgi:hypothetical protein